MRSPVRNTPCSRLLVAVLLLGPLHACAAAPGAEATHSPGTSAEATTEGSAPDDPCSGYSTPGAASNVQLAAPEPGATLTSPLHLSGRAKGSWYFEGDFPVTLHDSRGAVLARKFASARGEWMTEDFVPFNGEIAFEAGGEKTGLLVLHRDNPSDDRSRDASVCIPVRF